MLDHLALPRINREINVTPMIDVLLVLLIIAIILNMTRQTIRAAVPEPPAQAASVPAPQLVLALTAAGGFEVNSQPVPRDALVEVIRSAISHRSNSVVFVTAAPNRTFQEVVEAMDLTKGAGVQVVALMPRAGEETGE